LRGAVIDELVQGCNPIHGVQMLNKGIDYRAIHLDLPFIDAFRIAVDKSIRKSGYQIKDSQYCNTEFKARRP